MALAVVAITLAAYLPCLDNDFTNWDDPQYVLDNPLLPHPSLVAILVTPVGGNYHPLTVLSLASDYRRSGLHAPAYHATSLALHLANTALVFLFVWTLTGGRRWTTAATALLFGIHPMHVESVAWVSERKDVLYALFYLLGLLAYWKYLERPRAFWWLATTLAFLLSLASKPAAVVFPVTLLALDWYRRRAWSPRWLIEKLPWFAMSVALGLLTISAQAATGALERQAALMTKVFAATYGLVLYVVKLIVPAHLSVIYPFPVAEGSGAPIGLVALLALALLAMAAALYFFRRHRIVAFGFAFYLINVALVLQFVGVGRAVMADRYSYLPHVGLLMVLAFPLDAVRAERVADLARRGLAFALAILAVCCFVATRARCDVWQDSLSLWNDTIQKYPTQVADAYVNRGFYYHRVLKDPGKALADYNKAIAIHADAPGAWNNRGRLLGETGQLDSAIVSFDHAIALRPKSADARNTRGGARLQKGDLAGGIEDISRAIALEPRFWDAYANRATAFAMRGEYEAAIADCRRLIELEPNHPDIHEYYALMATALRTLGRNQEAIAAFDRAIALAPVTEPQRANYYLQRGLAWGALGDTSRESADRQEAERLQGTTRR